MNETTMRILELKEQGLTNKQIALEVGILESSIKSRLSIYRSGGTASVIGGWPEMQDRIMRLRKQNVSLRKIADMLDREFQYYISPYTINKWCMKKRIPKGG